jgi:hypothetical protein
MAARSRPRGGQLKEEFVDEERAIWNSIRNDARRVDQLMVGTLGRHKQAGPEKQELWNTIGKSAADIFRLYHPHIFC